MDRTEHQSSNQRQQARELSLEPARPPTEIAGYKISQFLGSGAFGEVWAAADQKTGRRVAIKFYTRRQRNDIQMLVREVEKLVALEADRYVVQLLDVGWEADPPYFVMEYIEHGSLEDRLASGFSIHADQAIGLFKEIATGMMHLHRKGIFHCDLKPGNVLLDQDGHPRVADFGQARLSSDDTPALGTLFYMAPEQADMSAVPEASWDVYSLGCLLFSMLTGRPPYFCQELAQEIETSDTIGERLAKYRDSLLAADQPADHRKIPGVDRALADIIDRCIAADPKRRYSSIESVLTALEAREFSRTRRPLLLLGLVGPLILLGIFGLFSYWAFSQALERTKEAVTAKAQDSNNYTAQMAAQRSAGEIGQYFNTVSQLAHDPAFVQKFQTAIEHPELRELRMELANPTDNDRLMDSRQQFRRHDAIKPLMQLVKARLEDRFNEYPQAASWFVCDQFGNQIASAFRTENRTLGKNYAYRSYFSGLHSDLPISQVPVLSDAAVLPTPAELNDDGYESLNTDIQLGQARMITQQPHLSGVFLSKQSKTWKVAFSTPIVRNQNEVIGLVAITVELGDLVNFVRDQAEDGRYAILVDGRPPDVDGARDYDGAILEHPIYGDLNTRHNGIPAELENIRIDLDQAADCNIAQPFEAFFDPVGQTETVKKLHKEMKYGEASIVSVVNVMMESQMSRLDWDQQKRNASKRQQATGLFVLVLQDYRNVQNDVETLSRQLQRLAGLAGVTLLLVLGSLAFFVSRLLKDSKSRLARDGAANLSAASVSTLPTVKRLANSIDRSKKL